MSSVGFLTLSNFDFAILGIVLVSSLIAFIRGFIKSAISLTGWVVSIAIGLKFYFLLMPIVGKYVAFDALATVISAFALFLISAVIIAVINNVFYLALTGFCGGFLDRSVGVLFGFIRGCSLVCCGFYILIIFMPQAHLTADGQIDYSKFNTAPQWVKNSKSIILLSKGADIVGSFIQTDFERKLKRVLKGEDENVSGGKEIKSSMVASMSIQSKITQVSSINPRRCIKSYSRR